MAKLFFGVEGQTLDLRCDLHIADADAPLVLGFLLTTPPYNRVVESVQEDVPDEDWSPSEEQTEADRPTISIQRLVARQSTPEEAAKKFAEETLAILLARELESRRAKAAAAAMAAITPIIPIA